MTPDEQYAANIALLSQQPSMLGLVAQMQQSPLCNLQLLPSPTGALAGCTWDVPTQQWVPLCDLNDPIHGAEAAIEQLWDPNHTIFTMLGMGMGYAVAAMTKKLLPYQRLVVWDPETLFFKATLYTIDIKSIFSGKNVEIYVGPDLLSRIEPWYLSREVHEKLHLQFPINHAYTSIYRKSEYQALMDKVMDMLRYHMVGLATWRQFGRAIGDNDIENIPEYYANPGINALKGLWAGKPAVCVAAGPSLQTNLAQLLPAEQRSKIALLTVGTCFGLLQGLGLQPDIVTTIDFQRLNYTDQFQHIPADPDTALVYLHSTYPQTPRRWPGPCFVAENSSDTMSWIKLFAGEEKGSCGQVQTVAHLNVLVALALGANPIILLGQDLSMPTDAHHAAGARAQDNAPQHCPPEAFLTAKDMHGKDVATRHSFQSMLLVFERIIAEHPATTFLNASEHGLPIRGAQHLPLAQALARLPRNPDDSANAVRPLFQGETLPGVQARTPSALRHAIRHVARSYVPPTLPTLPEAFDTLTQQVEDIGQWACQAIDAWQAIFVGPGQEEWQRLVALDTSSEVLTEGDMVESLWSLPRYEAMMASEKVLQERPYATGMFVIRRFDFVELKGEIPPPPGSLHEPWQLARYTASRLYRAAQMFVEELPQLRLLLHRTRLRMAPAPSALHACARQQYRHALQYIRDNPTHPEMARLLAQVLRHQHAYPAALALMDLWDNFPTEHTAGTARHAQRMRMHLTRMAADVRHAIPAYFHTPPRPAPDQTLGDMTYEWTTKPPPPVNGFVPTANGHAPGVPVPAEAALTWHGEE